MLSPEEILIAINGVFADAVSGMLPETEFDLDQHLRALDLGPDFRVADAPASVRASLCALVAKGFLAQSKLLDIGEKLSSGEQSRLRQQCGRMLAVTSDAFVVLYGKRGVRVVSANAVFGTSHRKLGDLGTKTIAEFFLDHFRCFIGYRAIGTTSVVPSASRVVMPLTVSLGVPRILQIEAIGQ